MSCYMYMPVKLTCHHRHMYNIRIYTPHVVQSLALEENMDTMHTVYLHKKEPFSLQSCIHLQKWCCWTVKSNDHIIFKWASLGLFWDVRGISLFKELHLK